MENDLFKSSVISAQPKDGLHIKCISLDGNLVPSKFDDSKLTPSQAKQLIDKYAFSTKCHIDELREQNSAKVKKARILPESKQAVTAVGSEETIYSIGHCGLFAAVLIAYNNPTGNYERLVFFKHSSILTLFVFPQEIVMSIVSYFCVDFLLSSLIARANCS